MNKKEKIGSYPAGGVAKRTALGTFANFFSQLTRVLEQFILTPLFLWAWGKATYGEWLTISSLVVYFSLSDVGMGNYVTNKLTQLYSKGEMEDYARVFKSALGLYGAVAVIFILFLGVFSFLVPFTQWFNVSAASAGAARISVFLLGFYCIGGAVFALLNNLYISVGEFVRYQVLANIREILVVASIALVLIFHGGFVPVASTYLVFILIFTVFILFDVRRRYPLAFKGTGKTDWKLARSFIAPGIAFLAIPLADMVKNQGGVLVVSSALGAVSVAIYSVHRTISNVTQRLTTMIKPSILPEIAANEERGDLKKIRLLHDFFLKLTMFFSTSMVMFLFFSGKDILRIWVRGSIQFDKYLLLAFMALALVDSLSQFSSSFQIAINKYYQYSSVTLTSSCVGILVGFFLVKPLGLVGVALGLFVAELSMDFWIVPIRTLKIVGESKMEFLGIMIKGLLLALIEAAIAYSIFRYLPHIWLRLGVMAIVVFGVGVAFTHFIWFNGDEREISTVFIKRALRKIVPLARIK